MADDIGIIDHGTLLEESSLEELKEKNGNDTLEDYFRKITGGEGIA